MEDFVEIRLWGEERLAFLRRFLPYDRGIPSHDTLGDVINALDPELFKRCFLAWVAGLRDGERRSEEHTSELQSLMRISYAVFCLKKKNKTRHNIQHASEAL